MSCLGLGLVLILYCTDVVRPARSRACANIPVCAGLLLVLVLHAFVDVCLIEVGFDFDKQASMDLDSRSLLIERVLK